MQTNFLLSKVISLKLCPLAILMPLEENPYIIPHLKALISGWKFWGGQRCGSTLSLWNALVKTSILLHKMANECKVLHLIVFGNFKWYFSTPSVIWFSLVPREALEWREKVWKLKVSRRLRSFANFELVRFCFVCFFSFFFPVLKGKSTRLLFTP